jgi:AcrR family transcriptional regulator
MSKGHDTRSHILRQALDLASEVGLEGLTIGALAKLVKMSKSGLYAHFASKEDLQRQVLDAAAGRFVEGVVAPAIQEARGLPRLRALFERWLNWATEDLSGGCPFVAAAAEFDDRPGPVRERLVKHQQDLLATLSRATRVSVGEGHLRADLDVEQLTFEVFGALLAYHHYARLMRREDARARASQAFERILRSAGGG